MLSRVLPQLLMTGLGLLVVDKTIVRAWALTVRQLHLNLDGRLCLACRSAVHQLRQP
jgi:hypothetical protein